MLKDVLILDNEIEISKGIIEDAIAKIDGKINDIIIEDESIIIIKWQYGNKENLISCISELYKQRGKTKIISEYKGSKNLINEANTKFKNAIANDSEVILVSENKKKETKSNNTSKRLLDSETEKFIKKSLIGILIVAFSIYLYDNSKNNSASDYSSNSFVTQSGYKAAFSENALQRLVTYSVHKDYNGINQLEFNNEIFDLPTGRKAYVIKSKLGRVKIKLYDEQLEVWTFSEAIKPK